MIITEFKNINEIIKKLDTAKEALFEGKIPDANPRLFMSMGGAGSGKTAVEEIAQAHCGDNFVIASLDEFRKKSDLYKVLTAASHHSDDYVYVEPFANRLRDSVADHAKNNHINIKKPVINTIKNLPNLTKLEIPGYYFITDESFKKLTKLQTLNINYCEKITGICFKYLKRLTKLSMVRCPKIYDSIFGYLSRLIYLNIDHNDQLTDKICDHLPKLQILHMTYCRITDKGLMKLTNLKELYIFSSSDLFTSKAFVNLKKLIKLTYTLG